MLSISLPVACYLVPSRSAGVLHVSFTGLCSAAQRLKCYSSIEWASFIVLDIGLAITDSLPGGTRAVAGLFQSFAVRASGFSIVSLASVAPAFQ